MSNRPTGTVTFLFTDIEGSTTLWENHREWMERAHKRQEQILRDVFARRNGYAYKMIGDAFQVAFATARDSVSAAVEAQRALSAEEWGEREIRVRMGIHTGVTEERDDDYVGPTLNRVARLMSAGYGGQVLVSQATYELVRDHLAPGLTLNDMGEHRLKNLIRPEHIYQLLAPDLPRDFPSLKTLDSISPAHETPAQGEPPYKGMQYFDEADAENFFGRETLTAKLADQLRAHPLLFVLGASGSGKSSLVRAGLVSALKRSNPSRVHIITPTAHPLEALAVSLTRDADSVGTTTTLIDDMARDPRSLHLFVSKQSGNESIRSYIIVVDQFEELFTLCRREDERQAFIDNLLAAASADGLTKVVVTLRADFYAHCAHHANLRAALAEHQEYIGPMTRAELRRAIEGPAQRGGWDFEPGLVDLILSDVGDEPGALPLLSHALLETWQRRLGRTLTFAGYAACGGVRSAIARTAESLYQNFPPEQQIIARNMFLRLTELGEGTQDTRRHVTLSELIPPFVDARAADEVLEILIEARLVTTDEGHAQVAHEALIREWSTLREWLNQNRESLRLHRAMTEAAQEWNHSNHDSGALYRGSRLAQAMEWAEVNRSELNPLEKEFLVASQDLLAREEAEREAQRQRELVAAQKLAETEKQRAEAERRRANILRWVTIGSTILLVVMIGLALFAFSQRTEAVAQRDGAEKAKADAEFQRQIAFVRELSVNAVSNLDIDPERSILLALQAVSASMAGGKPVLREAEEALHRAVSASRVQLTLRGHTAGVIGVAFSPDGRRIATTSRDYTAKVWVAATGQVLLTFSGHTGQIYGITFSPDSKRLATASFDNTAKVWDATTGKELLTLTGHTDRVSGVAFSPDGTRLATSSGIRVSDSVDHTAKVWDATTGKELLTLIGHTNGVTSVAFSPDGKRLAIAGVNSVAFDSAGTRIVTSSGDGTVKVWDAATGQWLLTLTGHSGALLQAVFSPDGTRVATASGDTTAKVWDVSPAGSREWLTLANHNGGVLSVAYSADGRRIATASTDKTAKVWDAVTGKELLTLSGHMDDFHDIVFSADGSRLVTNSNDRTVKVWDAITGKELLTIPTQSYRNVNGLHVAISPDGQRIAAPGPITTFSTSGGGEGVLKLWDIKSGKELLTLTGHRGDVYGVAFSPDGKRIATVSSEGTAKVWDAESGKELLTLVVTIGLFDVSYSPDGRRIATASGDGTAKVWDAASGQLLLTLSGHTGQVWSSVFSPDGTRLATASNDGTTKVWDVSLASGRNEQPLTLYGHSGSVSRAIFSPDGKRLVTASFDGTARVYALPLEDIIAIAKSRVTRTLTTDECQKYLHVEQCPVAQ